MKATINRRINTTKNVEYPKHDKIYDLCMIKAKSENGKKATLWLHLSDAVEIGTISPMEAYDTIKLGYIMENLKIRKSRYSHLI